MNAAHDPSSASAADGPIAVVGMGCRLPGAADPGAYWTLLREGRDAVTDAPPERWPAGAAAGPRRGGFIEDVDAFDAAFFGIAPHEADAMDPQQRLVLELAWHALENARIVPTSLRSTATGVFIGAIADDYATLRDRLGADAAGSHTLTGTQRGVIANRVSYVLGLGGPSLTVDTGQSSSLVAVQAACESLRRGETTTALAGGVNLNLLPETTEVIDRFGDYGQIGLLAVREDGDTLNVQGWTLSCRALGRGVEERLLQWLADRAEALGCTAVRLTAEHTPRNAPARRLVAALGGGEPDGARLEAVAAPDELRAFRSWRS
ncbi:beta-ketoacyl synthase N-terminal-like domain-containing protein [Streptomyces jumonjinensis]|uniref:Ketosynthase family 3 (KS3) domain-containing protein n=1 Tax=Streptomyces jumonjinensis TaxID=1945 RepID=A0A646KL18_STRJU|nr:hypothetical protein [Streptomyces jumonjinensis]